MMTFHNVEGHGQKMRTYVYVTWKVSSGHLLYGSQVLDFFFQWKSWKGSMDALALRCKWLPHGTRVGGQRPGKDSAPPWSRWPPELGRGTLRLPWALCHWRALMRCCLVSWGSSRAGGRNGVTTIEAISLLISARWTTGINEKYQYFSSAWPCDRRNAKGEWNCSLRSMKETYNSPLGQ